MDPISGNADMPPFPWRTIHFASFNVTSQVYLRASTHYQDDAPNTRQVFHVTAHSFALVNLKPLLPGHILVSPLRPLPRLTDLSSAEINDLFNTVTRIQRTLTRLYKADGFNVAVQDGEAAGQSVPHVHCHVIPRTVGDPGGGDKVHEWLEGEEGNVGEHQREAEGKNKPESSEKRKKGEWAQDEDRKPRSKEEMEKEAKWLRREMAKDERADGKI